MKYCKKCLQPDTRPNTRFDENGVCPTCVYAAHLADVDWQARFEELDNILETYRAGQKNRYLDCIVGVSGGKDSTRQALYTRDKLGLRPLLVCLSHPPQQVSEIGVSNISNLIEHGFDVVVLGPGPETWRRLMRESFFRFTNWARSTELALFSSVPQVAIRYKIPLILWGESSAQVGDSKSLGNHGWDGNSLRYSNTLSSGHTWMLEMGFKMQELFPYRYPGFAEFEREQIQIVFLGWFLGDWSLKVNAMHSGANGLQIREETVLDTGDLLGVSNLDEDWHYMNQMIKYYKFGFGKVTEYVNEDIRLGHMSRQKAVRIVEDYDGLCSDRYVESFCEYIDISVDEFWSHVRKSVNRELFDVKSDSSIVRKFKIGVGL